MIEGSRPCQRVRDLTKRPSNAQAQPGASSKPESSHDTGALAAPHHRRVLLLVALGWALATVLRPAIQRTIVLTTGADNGIYRGFADRYAPILKRDGITLDIRSSSGSVQNYQRLKDPDSEYEVGFVQSGTTSPKETDHLQTIAAVSYEPIWVFYRGETIINRLAQLSGKRIAIGIPRQRPAQRRRGIACL
jgi:TRAP-type uncharacterized transport system substrate-binding protein